MAYPIAPITPSLRCAYPRFVAGIQTSKQSSVICEISVARSLHHQLISPPAPHKSKEKTHLSKALPCDLLASWSSGPPFSAVRLSARRRPSVRRRDIEAVEERRERRIPESQKRWEIVFRRVNLLRREEFGLGLVWGI
jgi:hypothetical protein